jgi:hypothetical protein
VSFIVREVQHMEMKDFLEQGEKLLIQQTDASVATFFASNALMVYEGTSKIAMLETRCLVAYTAAVQTVEKFVYDTLLLEVLAKNVRHAEAVVYLPDKDLRVAVDIESSLAEPDTFLQDNVQEVIETPIGVFDDFTFKMLQRVPQKDNPLKILFQHIFSSVGIIVKKLDDNGVDWRGGVVDSELLTSNGLQEAVEVHRMLYRLLGVERSLPDFFEG